ncbi:proteasomal regulatory protein Rpn11 [Hamiltosporidium tvaerminnensis]|uniref:Proteasomal regulatory protein Rpn11 n=2 Tax=Hamiltosporidium TaxID=1176354 RepID=A0A4Q9LXK8_9MICR|nr:multicatalytic endopeptidase [Hamiltosporidium tvaerminnensis]TBT97391.1 proteasomal regulatory protein Rpn11 [Hamiltosporidium magnivora]TBU00481.1 proteasomal regulatory protein Rpn11 [Hamiltosporidium tvaerminnensis]TBU13116.1 proteasomal regulatory protein Rpn11 [Hamiltosporidium tvaerminnensis]
MEYPIMETEENMADTSETVQISSLALLKMLKHGRAGIPLEVMGLMLGEFVDDYTVNVVDVFAMPQSGTGVTVEAVDPVFQTKMLDLLAATGRHETVVGWYHSHPGFGCWLSSVDISTQSSFEQLCKRAVAVVIDPIQSVKGKVVIDAFRLINTQMSMMGIEPRQISSNIGYEAKPTLVSILHGLNRHYYSFRINYRKNELEQRMLKNLHKKTWADTLKIGDKLQCRNDFKDLLIKYFKDIEERKKLLEKGKEISKVGKADNRKCLLDAVTDISGKNSIYDILYSIHYSIFK